MAFLKTREVARPLGVRYHALANRLRDGRLVAPGKDSSGDYVWLPADIEMARLALAAPRLEREAVAHA
jgi:hypothetical protein